MTNNSLQRTTQPGRIFESAFKRIQTHVPYDPAWSNGAGYFPGIVDAAIPKVELPGDMGKSIDPTGRRIIVIATRFGNVAVYDRYAGANPIGGVYSTSGPKNVVTSVFISGNAVGESEMIRITGGWDYNKNIGWKIELMAEALRP